LLGGERERERERDDVAAYNCTTEGFLKGNFLETVRGVTSDVEEWPNKYTSTKYHLSHTHKGSMCFCSVIDIGIR
jgi:hypothetical protein